MTPPALILIDIQNDYFPGGALPLHKPEAAANKAQALLMHFRKQGWPVVHIQHETTDPHGFFMLPGTPGQQLHDSVTPQAGEPVILKHYPSAFWQTNLEQHLRSLQVNQLVIAGMMTHMCVSTTTRAAMERGFEVSVVSDACATLALPFQEETIDADVVHKTALAELLLLAKVEDSPHWLNAA